MGFPADASGAYRPNPQATAELAPRPSSLKGYGMKGDLTGFHKAKVLSLFFDDLVKSRHSRAGGNPESAKLLKRRDSRFHGNDGKAHFQTFYEAIIF
jgi:hypothetical protein